MGVQVRRFYYVTFLSKCGEIKTHKFTSLYQARRFAWSLNTAGLEITSQEEKVRVSR